MSYSELRIYGDCDVNYVWSRKSDLEPSDVATISQKGIFTPIWDEQTVMLGTFCNTPNASNISGTVGGYLIHRQKLNENVRYKIAEVDSTVTNIKDFNIGSRSKYQYFITPIYMNDREKLLGEPILTDNIQTEFDSWSIIGLIPTAEENIYTVDAENIWNFYVEADGGTFSLKDGKIVTTGLGKYPKAYVGETDYIEGSLSCLIGRVNCESGYCDDNIEKIERWRAFCKNGCLKLLRDMKGHIIPCEITDTSYENDDQYDELQTIISFNFTQLDDSKNISVYSVDEIEEVI